MKPKLKDETGNRYGRLTVLRRYDVHDPSQRGAYWLCRCDCGTEVAVISTRLRNGNTRSCGCLREMSKAERQALGFEPIYGRKRVKKTKPAAYEIRVKPDGMYCLIIQGAIKYDDLTFAEAISKISEAEAAEGKD